MFWVAACFALTSVVYLAWVYRLVDLGGGKAIDWATLVLGYLCQAAGLFLVCHAGRTMSGSSLRQWFLIMLLLFSVLSIAALMGDNFTGTMILGLLMNIAFGVIAGIYLFGIADTGSATHSSLLFGGGYALGTFAVGLLAIPGNGTLLRGIGALLFCLIGCLCLAAAAHRSRFFDADVQEEKNQLSCPARFGHSQAKKETAAFPLPEKVLALACAAVLLASMVKNVGFTFPSSDIADGLRPELSRLPYGIGLIAAGLINDRNRKNGIICTITALAIPFIMLNVQSEPVPRTLLWGLDYLFFSFFSVTRVILFIDLARKSQRRELIPLGLLLGRVGDAAGTALGLLLADRRLLLILTTAVCFIVVVFLLFRLYQKLYEPQSIERKSEREVYEAFCMHHDLSLREQEILRMMLDNHTNTEIAEGLFISVNTVKCHVRNVLQKTGCKNRVELQKKYKLALYPHLSETSSVEI